MYHFFLVPNELGHPSTGMMVKWRVINVYPAFSTWILKWTENCLNVWNRAIFMQRTVTTGGPGVDTGARTV